MIAAKILVDGIVQGVGFRWFVLKIASSYGIKGWVKNRFRGDVEIYAEADREIIDAFIREIKKGPSFGRVDAVDVTWVEALGKYHDFQIAR